MSEKIIKFGNQYDANPPAEDMVDMTNVLTNKVFVGGSITGGTKIIESSIINGTINGVAMVNVSVVANDNANIVPLGLTVLSTGITTGIDGTQSAYVILSWTAVSEDTFDHYLIRYKKHSYTYYTYLTAGTNVITIDGLVPNVAYDFGVASVNKYGIQSAFSTDVAQTTASDTAAPSTVTAGSATGGIQYVILEWTHNAETDLASYNVYRSETNNSATAALIGNCRTNYFVDGNRTGGTTYYYWVKAVDTSGNVSAAFSTVKSAAPRNVTSDDIVTIAGSKVLIDGTVYLSNWRHSGDLTKIDGGDIYANSVTLTQLNFVPVQGTNVIASINASPEGIEIDADNFTVTGATVFTKKVAGTYASAASGSRVLIFPDANTGLQVIDDGANDVFKCIIGGTNVGDVQIGNYASGQGALYDKSAGLFNFKGTIVAGTVFVGTDASLLEMAAVADFPPDTNLVGYWAFDEGAGSVANDGSNNGNNGTITGATFVVGIKGTGLSFNGTTNYVNCGDIDISLPITMAAWINADAAGALNIIISKWDSGWVGAAYVLCLVGGKLKASFGDGTNNHDKTSTNSVGTGAWHYVAAVMQGKNNIQLYIDGVEAVGTYSGTATTSYNNSAPVLFGQMTTTTPDYNFDGKMDDIRIYSSALTPAQIYALYKNPGQGKSLAVPVGRLTSGQILSKQITLALTPGAGDSFIACGKTDFDHDEAGFILGYDDTDDAFKFIIGTTSEYLMVNGNTLTNKLKAAPYEATVGGMTLLETETARNTQSTTYVKLKEIKIGRDGNYKLYWSAETYMTAGKKGYVELRKVHEGSEAAAFASYNFTSPDDYSDTVDLNSYVQGDKIRLYAKVDATPGGDLRLLAFDLKVDDTGEGFPPFYISGYD